MKPLLKCCRIVLSVIVFLGVAVLPPVLVATFARSVPSCGLLDDYPCSRADYFVEQGFFHILSMISYGKRLLTDPLFALSLSDPFMLVWCGAGLAMAVLTYRLSTNWT